MLRLGRWLTAAWCCPVNNAAATTLDKRLAHWESQASTCPSGGKAYPTGLHETVETGCSEGDMTLFNKLLCVAGVEFGYEAAREVQDPNTTQWHRSPQIHLLGYNDQGNTIFSPDMDLGAQLYFIKTRGRDQAYNLLIKSMASTAWWMYAPFPPGDAAVLEETVNWL